MTHTNQKLFGTREQPKSDRFTLQLKITDNVILKKGETIIVAGQERKLEAIRNIDVRDGIIYVSGKCK